MHTAAPNTSIDRSDSQTAPCQTVSDSPCGDICQSGETLAVRNSRHSSSDDLRRELAIQQLGREIEGYMAAVAAINNRDPHTFADFADAAMQRGQAELARLEMERLIRGRSPEQRARMLAAQRARMEREPGAERS
jgi:hypothetical protein